MGCWLLVTGDLLYSGWDEGEFKPTHSRASIWTLVPSDAFVYSKTAGSALKVSSIMYSWSLTRLRLSAAKSMISNASSCVYLPSG